MNWLWFVAGVFVGALLLSLVVGFFAIGTRSDSKPLAEPGEKEPKRNKSGPRLIKNGGTSVG